MKKKYFLPIVLIAILFTGCTKEFLDRTPLDTVDDSNFWTSESNLRLHSIYYYRAYFFGYGSGWDVFCPANRSCFNTDVQIGSSGLPGGLSAGDYSGGNSSRSYTGASYLNEESWGNAYIWIRRANIFIDRVENNSKGVISDEAYKHWLGVARFLRAFRYADLVWGFGNVPYFDKAEDSMDILCKDRDNIYAVGDTPGIIDNIIDDFQYGVDNCRADDGGNNLINKYIIATAGARWMFWIGCYQKYGPATYFGGNQEYAKKCLAKAVEWANVVKTSGKYSIQTDYRTEYTSDNLSANKGIIMARFYSSAQIKHSMTTYRGNFVSDGQNSGGGGGTPNAHYMRNVVLFWDGKLQPSETTVIADAGNPDNYGKLYTMLDNALVINKDPRLEAQIHSIRTMTAGSYIGAETFAYTKLSNTRYYVRALFPRQYADYLLESSNTITELGAPYNITNAPVYRYSDLLLTWIAAKAELADGGLGGPAVTQQDLDESINVVRNRPLATGVKNPALTPQKLPALTLGSYPTDPTRDPDVSPLLWEIRRERTVECFSDWVRNKDLRAFGKFLPYMERFDTYPGKYCNEPNDPSTGYTGLYNGGTPGTGWGEQDNSGVYYYRDTPEGNLLQCGAYFELDALYNKWKASYEYLKNNPAEQTNPAKVGEELQNLLSLQAFIDLAPRLWCVTKDGEQRIWKNYKLYRQDDYSGWEWKTKADVGDANYDIVVPEATVLASMQRMRGWLITVQHSLSLMSAATNQRSWLSCVPISQIIYYKNKGYTLTQNPGYSVEI